MGTFELLASELALSSSDCIFALDAHGQLEQANDACRRWFSGEPSRWVGRSLDQLIRNEALRAHLTETQARLTSGMASLKAEHPIQAGSFAQDMTLYCQTISDDCGKVLGYGYRLAATTASTSAEYEQIMLHNLMENCEDLVYFKDLKSRFTRVSDTMVERLEAGSREEIIGKTDFDFWDENSATTFKDIEIEIMNSGVPRASMTESAVRPDGEQTWSLATKMPLRDHTGKVVGIFGINKDITVQKKFESELELANKELVTASRRAGMAEVATCVLHNIGNVLNSINVAVMRVLEMNRGMKIDNLEKASDLLQEIGSTGRSLFDDERGKRIPDYLIQLSRALQDDQQNIGEELRTATKFLEHLKAVVATQQQYAVGSCVLEKFELNELLEDAIRMSSRSLDRHAIELVREIAPSIRVTSDKHRLLQTLVNLIRNGKQALKLVGRSDKQMTIGVKYVEPGKCSIYVKDNGIGMAEEDLVKIFAHGFTKREEGHGFGLHSGANFAKEIGGSLVASSEGIGKGATFTLTLPINSADSLNRFPLVAIDASPNEAAGAMC